MYSGICNHIGPCHHYIPYVPYCPPVIPWRPYCPPVVHHYWHDCWSCISRREAQERDERLREEGRRQERERQRRRPYPYVDITPALPHRDWCG